MSNKVNTPGVSVNTVPVAVPSPTETVAAQVPLPTETVSVPLPNASNKINLKKGVKNTNPQPQAKKIAEPVETIFTMQNIAIGVISILIVALIIFAYYSYFDSYEEVSNSDTNNENECEAKPVEKEEAKPVEKKEANPVEEDSEVDEEESVANEEEAEEESEEAEEESEDAEEPEEVEEEPVATEEESVETENTVQIQTEDVVGEMQPSVTDEILFNSDTDPPLVNGTTAAYVSTDGIVENAGKFGYGPDDGISVLLTNNIPQSGSISFWFKYETPDDAQERMWILGHSDYQSGEGWGFFMNLENRKLSFYKTNEIIGVSTSSSIEQNSDFVFVVLTYTDNGTLKLYLDGNSDQGNADNTRVNWKDTNILNIGNVSRTSDKFKGEIDEVILYDKVLSDAEVLGLYNQYTQ